MTIHPINKREPQPNTADHVAAYDVVRGLLGIVLLAASVAKGYELATGAGTQGNLSLPGRILGAIINCDVRCLCVLVQSVNKCYCKLRLA